MIIKLKQIFFILSFTFGHTSGFIDIRFVVWYSGVLIYIYLMCSCRFRCFIFLSSYSSLLKYSSCLKWPPIFCLKIWNLSCCCWYIGCCAEYLTCVTLINDLDLRPLPWNPPFILFVCRCVCNFQVHYLLMHMSNKFFSQQTSLPYISECSCRPRQAPSQVCVSLVKYCFGPSSPKDSLRFISPLLLVDH